MIDVIDAIFLGAILEVVAFVIFVLIYAIKKDNNEEIPQGVIHRPLDAYNDLDTLLEEGWVPGYNQQKADPTAGFKEIKGVSPEDLKEAEVEIEIFPCCQDNKEGSCNCNKKANAKPRKRSANKSLKKKSNSKIKGVKNHG